MKQPNILLFCVDEMRADHMGCMGNRVVRTPNIDRIAARGTLFRRAYCNNPICMPARASMFTGLLPRDHGLRMNGQSLRTHLPTLPQMLADSGYRTHAAGKLHLTPWVPQVEPPDIVRYPECPEYWNRGDIREFPAPYYGFRSIDFVGGHTSGVYGPYIQWLREQGGDPGQLRPQPGRDNPIEAPHCFRMALSEELHYNRYIADSAISVIRESASGEAPPFFIWCSFPDPHPPIAPPAPYSDMYDPADVHLPARREGEYDSLPSVFRRMRAGEVNPYNSALLGVTDRQWREMIALTYGMITHVDAEVGRALNALADSGQDGNTIIGFIADHGDMMGDHELAWKAFYTFRGCIQIPFALAAPGMPAGRSTDALVSQIDLLPTILDLCGFHMPGNDWRESDTPWARGAIRPLRTYPGRSFRGLLDGSADNIRDEVVIENDDPTTGYQVRAIVTPGHRLTIYPGTSEGELFDLEKGPDELVNVWDNPDYARIRADLTTRLLHAYSLATPMYPVPPWNS